MPLSSQREVSQRQDTERQLQEIRNALIGFAQANNRLPCPAAATDLGVAPPQPCLPGRDRIPHVTLGIQGTIINGNLVDVWQQPIRYRLANPAPGGWVYATPPIPTAPLFDTPLMPYLQICPAAGACPTPNAVDVVAVIFSTGKDGPDVAVSTSPDQVQNRLLATTNFVMRPPTEYVKTGLEFDDIVVWISQPTLIYELSRAGQ